MSKIVLRSYLSRGEHPKVVSVPSKNSATPCETRLHCRRRRRRPLGLAIVAQRWQRPRLLLPKVMVSSMGDSFPPWREVYVPINAVAVTGRWTCVCISVLSSVRTCFARTRYKCARFRREALRRPLWEARAMSIIVAKIRTVGHWPGIEQLHRDLLGYPLKYGH
jgi:hypothetical protein